MTNSAEPVDPGIQPQRGVKRLLAATRSSLAGLAAAWHNEAAFRQEAVMAVVLLPAALWLGTNAVETVLLAGTVLLVLIVELLNSAIEATIDRIGPERHELSGRAKDLGSAAVMLSLVLCALTWGWFAGARIFGP
ncbi:MAG: diacylglycerol kinase [Chromatiales bacterium]|nr:MAG: diacylglycerol kinase [Chromatiales bacterium]